MMRILSKKERMENIMKQWQMYHATIELGELYTGKGPR